MHLVVPWNPIRRLHPLAASAVIACLSTGCWALAQEVAPPPPVARTPVAADPFTAVQPAASGRSATPTPTPTSAPVGPRGAGPSGPATPKGPGPARLASGPPVARSLNVRNGQVTLAGTLLLPHGTGPFPAVVLLPGRGAAGRRQAAADAHLFASHGIAAYTYDKRGTGASSGDWRTTLTLDDQIGDAVAAVAALRRQALVDPHRVGVWGVGQGAWLAPFVGEHADVAFLILLNAAAAPLGQEEVWQAGDVVRAGGFSTAAADAAMRAVHLMVGARPVLAALLPWSQLGFLRNDPARSPAQALERARAPALLVYDNLDPGAPGLKSTANLLRAAQNRDQPLDHVTVLARPTVSADGAGAGGNPAAALANAQRVADAAYRSVVLDWTDAVLAGSPVAPVAGGSATAVGTAALAPAGAGTVPTAREAAPNASVSGPASDRSLLLPGSSDRRLPWYANPWLQLGGLLFFLVAFGEGLVMSVLPLRRPRAAEGGTPRGLHTPFDLDPGAGLTSPAHRAASLLRLVQALVSLVDLALLIGTAMAIAFLLGFYRPAGLSLPPLASSLRALSALSGALAVALAVAILLARRAGARQPHTAVAVVVALAAALFLPFLVYWHVPFLAG